MKKEGSNGDAVESPRESGPEGLGSSIMEEADSEPSKHEKKKKKKKKKQKVVSDSVGMGGTTSDLDSSGAEARENLSGDRKKRAAREIEVGMEKYRARKDVGERVEDVKSKRKKEKDMITDNAESSDSTSKRADKWKSIRGDRGMRDEAGHEGSSENRKRKKELEDTGFESEKDVNKKRKKVKKDKVVADVENVSKGIPGRAFGNEERLAEEEKEASKDGIGEMQSSLKIRDEKKNKRKKEKKEGTAEHVKLPPEGIANVDMNGGNKLKLKALVRISENKVIKETSSIENEKNINNSMNSKTKEKSKADKWKPIMADRGMGDETGREGSSDNKKRKKRLEDTGLESEKNGSKKREKARKNKVVRDVENVSKVIPDRAFDNEERLAEEEKVASEDEIKSSLETRDEKKNKRKEKKKEGMAKNIKLSPEVISNVEMNGGNKLKPEANKISENKVIKETSIGNEKNVNNPMISKTKEKSKAVSFSSHVEVFPSANGANHKEDYSENGLVQGKRFSPEEDEMVKEAVINYIEENHLGEEGLQMVLNCRSYPQIRGCWQEIGAALPWRPHTSVYYRAHVLFQRSEKRKWEPEELEMLRRHYEENGAKWKQLAEVLGKHRLHVKDAWRRNKLPNVKKGHWSQEEYQTLFDLVNMDLRMKAFQEKKTKHGMLRENISWEAISTKMSTRYMAGCCQKWYYQLASPLVNQGLWDDADDYFLLDALLKLDACCVEDVDWDNLLENRSGEICRKRWNQMIKHIGGHRERSFMEQVEVLSARYCPDMLEYRSGGVEKL